MVRPILEYATIWSPHLQYYIHQLEKVKFNVASAARFVTNDFSYCSSVTSMLINLKWPILNKEETFYNLLCFIKFYMVLLTSQSL